MKKYTIVAVALLLLGGVLFAQNDLIGTQCTIYYSGEHPDFTGLSAKTLDANKQCLDKVISTLKANKALAVRVDGYANPVKGTSQEQTKSLLPLSRDRASYICTYLELFGISRNRIKVNYHGGSSSLTGPASMQGWMNRRVVITFCEF
jgi:outer membrane protein OmpA-like peptidoglycan-associated protein